MAAASLASRGPGCATSFSTRGRLGARPQAHPARIAVLLEEPHRRGGPPREPEPRRVPGAPRRPASHGPGRGGGRRPRRGGRDRGDRRGRSRAAPGSRRGVLRRETAGRRAAGHEHLLQRLYGTALHPRSLRLTCPASGSVGTRPRRGGAPPPPPCGGRAAADDGPAQFLRAPDRARRPAGRAGSDHYSVGRAGPARDGGSVRSSGPRDGGARRRGVSTRAPRGARPRRGKGRPPRRLPRHARDVESEVNLTGARTPIERVRLLVGTSSPRPRSPPRSLIDVGRGTGLPASSSPSCATTST